MKINRPMRSAVIWISDDPARLPLRVEGQTELGTAEFVLTSFEAGRRTLLTPKKLLGMVELPGDVDRQALDQEVQQRLAEIDRIATQTTFNGQRVLDGSFGSAVFQIGANVGETIGVNLSTSMRTSSP